jgi:exoribonuclease R
MSELVGVLKLNDKKLHGHTKKGLPIYTFIPLSWMHPTFLVASSSREKSNVLAVIQPEIEPKPEPEPESEPEADGGLHRGTCIQVIGPAEDKHAYDQALMLKNNLRANLRPHRLKDSLEEIYSGDIDYPEIIVIDPEGSTDCDDGFHISDDYLYVHIADVDHYFPENGTYETEIRKRVTSIYSIYKVYHMLPEKYASDIISLNKKGIKHTLTAVFKITDNTVSFIHVHVSTVKVKHSLSYERAQDIMENETGLLVQTLRRLSELTGSSDTHKMIERIMVWTNEAIAKFIYDNGVNFSVYCEGPDSMQSVSDLPVKLKQILSRKGIGANYSTEKHGHQMMGLEHYTHFTSPIRRYADLVVHRIVKNILEKRTSDLVKLAQDAEHINIVTGWSKKYYRDQDVLVLLSKLKCEGGQKASTGYIIDIAQNKVSVYLTEFDLIIRTPLFDDKLKEVIKVSIGDNLISLDINGQQVSLPLLKEIQVSLTCLETEIRLNRKIRVTFPIISSAVLF